MISIIKRSFFIGMLGFTMSSAFADQAAVDRTRQQINMLDDLYKTAVVLITEHYVQDPSALSAASAAKALFSAMDKKGWHKVRLIGLTDTVYNPENRPQNDFERAVVESFARSVTALEQVVTEDGRQYLLYATPLPVVMDKCTMCHNNFKGNTGNIGALVYKMPLID